MGDFISSVTSILTLAERQVEISGQNIANTTTPGYKKRVAFSTLVAGNVGALASVAANDTTIDFSEGKIIQTKNSFDLALSGPGFFAVRAPEGLLYTRQGEFRRDADGRLVTLQGYALQADGGGDLVLKDQVFAVNAQGELTDGGEVVGRIAVVDVANRGALRAAQAGYFTAPEDQVTAVDRPQVKQGALEASNVSTGDEMIAIMAALRRAESGQRLMGVYDDLMGRAAAAFGQS